MGTPRFRHTPFGIFEVFLFRNCKQYQKFLDIYQTIIGIKKSLFTS